jgi:hypothetical protein
MSAAGAATLSIGADGDGEIAFGARAASLEIGYGRSMVCFTGTGAVAMHALSGDGSEELTGEGTNDINFADHNGDEAILTARRMPSSTAC